MSSSNDLIQPRQKDSSNFKIMHYVIPGIPIPLARARHTRDRVYDSQKHLKLSCGLYLANQHGSHPLFTGPLHLTMTFYLPSTSKHLPGKHHIFRPDLSNLIKFYEDIAIGIIYHDDCIISSITAEKIYDPNPRTDLIVKEIHGKEGEKI